VLSRLQKDLGITFIYVTHSQSEAFAMADRVVIMSQGKIEQVGAPLEVYRKPASRFVAEFVGSNNIFSGKVQSVAANAVNIETTLGQMSAESEEGASLNVGDKVEVVISADNFEIASSMNEEKSVIQCSVVSEEFIGTVVSLLLETEGGVELKIQKQQREIAELDLHVGAELWINWLPDAVYLLP